MTWMDPKTNWHGTTNAKGEYEGDRFNASDFNRIKNNLNYLKDLANSMYRKFSIHDLGGDRTPSDYFYADEINKLEENLTTINERTVNMQYGESPTYHENGNTMNYTELNRLEKAILDLYEKLTNQSVGRRTFVWNFGMKGEL